MVQPDRFYRSLVSIVLLTSLFAATGCSTQTAPGDAAELQGGWHATSASRNGEPADDVLGHLLQFNGATFKISDTQQAVLYSGKFSVRYDESPAQIDFQVVGREEQPVTWKGIYEQVNNRLTICDNAPETTQSRPATFAAAKNSGHILIQFERVDE